MRKEARSQRDLRGNACSLSLIGHQEFEMLHDVCSCPLLLPQFHALQSTSLPVVFTIFVDSAPLRYLCERYSGVRLWGDYS